MSTVTRRKVQVNSTMSPILAKAIDEGVESGKYSSQSDYVSIAVTEHAVREEQREKENKMAELYSVLVQHKEGRNLLNEVPRTTREKIEAFKKAGIAHVEVGEYDKANECFAKAKELEAKPETNTPTRIVYDHQKEKEECMNAICPEPRELTPEEARKADEAHEYYKKLLGEEEEEDTVSEQLKNDKVPDKINRRVTLK